MRAASQERKVDFAAQGDEQPSLTDILMTVVQALVDQGHLVPDVTQAMRYVADMTDMLDRVYGGKT